MSRKKNYPCAACDGKGETNLQPGNLKLPCGYCGGKGNLPSQWWYESVMRRCGKRPIDSTPIEMEFTYE